MLMCRLFVLLIATIVVSTFSIQPAAGQFPIPKIRVPTVPKTNTPSTPNKPETVSPSADTGPATPAPRGEVRGRPIPGAKITFSNNPDGSNPKTSFTSSEYIYGRLDLGGKTVYDAFGLKNQTDVPIYYIHYDLKIYKPGERPYDGNWGGAFNQTLVTKEDAMKTYWNFDVLPDPTKISTLKSMLANEKDFSKKNYAGIYTKWHNADAARSTFPQSGTYTIDVTIWGEAYDDWGKAIISSTMPPTASAMFAFEFSGTDGQTLIANREKANKTVEAIKNASEMLRAMPDWWARGAVPPEAKLTPARLTPMIKSYIGQWDLTYVKHMIYPFKGSVWAIEKNDLGIPRYRRVTSAIYVIYKDPKDNACKLGYVEMIENYAGGGTYSAPHLTGISDVKLIECSVIK
jgi:hypothetical protein